MHKFGITLLLFSIAACVLGLALGFWDLIKHGENSFWLMMVPASFLGLMTGVVITLFSKQK